MDNAVTGVILGALVGVIAPILNSYFSNRFSAFKEDRDYKRKLQRDRISATKQLYEDALTCVFPISTLELDPDKKAQLQELNIRYGLRLELAASPEIVNQFRVAAETHLREDYDKLTQLMKEHIESLT